MLPERPARQQQVAVAPFLQPDVELVEVGGGVEGLDELAGLVVVPRSRHVPVHLLKADQVRVLVLDDLDHPLETVAAVTTADAFVDVITKKSHDQP